MLVLTRKKNESVMFGEEIKITILDIRGDSIRLGIEAPKKLTVLRGELYQAVKEENTRAAGVEQSVLEQLRIWRGKKTEQDGKEDSIFDDI
ncbi:carbon storage regulator CsrA [Desulfolucanica intricata]|uniref:carbon storage regulator CsrA n=1 Tax=Desulfolucanica intricata TaxID=1285191 RepID=UPI0009ED7E4B|nr:carbon storage regulator CsrA [Desulfolucanica intricata]